MRFNSKTLICLIIFGCMIMSLSCVSAHEQDSNVTDSLALNPLATSDVSSSDVNNVCSAKELDMDIQSLLPEDTYIQNSDNLMMANSIGSFDDLQNLINNASDDSVLFLDNDYSGDVNSVIFLNKNLIIDGQGHTIDCLNKKNCFVFYSESGHITLQNLIIANSRNYYANMGGAIYITGSAQYDIKNCTFSKNWADTRGGAIFNNGTNPLSITDSRFINNMVFDDCGGAIYSKSIVNIKDCVFGSNSAVSSGGAIYCENYISIIDCLFEKNNCEAMNSCGSAINAKGTVWTYNTIFRNNRALKNGGAIQSKKIIAFSCSFEDNLAVNGNGGAIYVVSADIINSLFNNNNALNNGGAVYSEDNQTISQSSFTSNSAKIGGGAIYCGNCVDIYDSIFESNKVYTLFDDSCGGAVFSAGANINSSSFINNYAQKNGGAIFVKYINVTDSTFISNQAVNFGGAIAVSYSLHDKFILLLEITWSRGYSPENFANYVAGIFSSTFVNNSAQYGGAINSDDAIIFSSTFVNNSAICGGAIYSNNNLNLFSSCFEDNYAKNDGGAIFSFYEMSWRFDVEFENNKFINNRALSGGAIYIYVDKLAYTVDTYNNYYIFKKCIFINNIALGSGGAIYCPGGVKINNSTFKYNYAEIDGGGVYIEFELELNDCVDFEGNIANTGSGGAIFTPSISKDILNMTFVNNSAAMYGGAIYVKHMNFNIMNSKFITNNAGDYGGALYIASFEKDCKIENCAFINNNATCDYSIYIVNNTFLRTESGIGTWIVDIFSDIKNYDVYNLHYKNNIFFNDRIYSVQGMNWNGGGDYAEWLARDIGSVLNIDVDNYLMINVDTVKVTFYICSSNGKTYDGNIIDMNDATFDVGSGADVVSKEFGRNSVTLELRILNCGSYPIKINFYGISLSARLNISPTYGAFPLISLEILDYDVK